jgi:predicted dehydrogenase
VRFALIGGGPGSFIGQIHRMAAELDGRLSLVAGVFSRDQQKNREAGNGYGVAPARIYPDITSLINAERMRPDGVELVTVATPNASHFEIARVALEAGMHVISDKPATATLQQARDLADIVAKAKALYALTYTYSGYTMVREARERVAAGALGKIRKIVVEYSQGWLSTALERDGTNKQAAWRTDPKQAGLGGAIGDIGVHAFHIAEYVSGCHVSEILPDLGHVVPGRTLDDDCNILLRFSNGARGLLHASQIATGDRNGLRLRIWGEKGGLDWFHERPEELVFNWPDQPTQIFHAGAPYLGAAARNARRLPSGHPEGFIEAFANIYRDFASTIRGDAPDAPVPGIADGLRGLTFVTRAAEARDARWISLDK